ncbi:MAG: 2-phospho-L-lactate transferase, partial [Solirubrobacteraceae bacterium]
EGRVLKGPTEAFMRWAGHPLSSRGIVEAYAGIIDGLVADEVDTGAGLPALQADVQLGDPTARRRVAELALDFATTLAPLRRPDE